MDIFEEGEGSLSLSDVVLGGAKEVIWFVDLMVVCHHLSPHFSFSPIT